jgi:AcrR family transcriptional regulator
MAETRIPKTRQRRSQHNESNAAVLPPKAENILLAARSVFLDQGFSAATTDAIQRAARVSKSTVYAEYPTKKTLFAAVIEREYVSLSASLNSLCIESNDVEQTLTALARAYLNVVLAPNGLALYRSVIGEAPRFPALARTFYQVGPKAATTIIEQYIKYAEEVGQINVRSIGTTTAANQFLSLVRSDAQLELLTHPDSWLSDAQLDNRVAAAVRTFLRAFGTSR